MARPTIKVEDMQRIMEQRALRRAQHAKEMRGFGFDDQTIAIALNVLADDVDMLVEYATNRERKH